MATRSYPSVREQEALRDAIINCGEDWARRNECSVQSGVANFLGSQPITVIVVSITDKLRANGFELVRIVPSPKRKQFSKLGEK
jgi:hypothetical protein